MFDNKAVADHYSHGELVDAIRAGVRDMGNSPETITVDDLAAVDEFHIGGRTASVDLLGQLATTVDYY